MRVGKGPTDICNTRGTEEGGKGSGVEGGQGGHDGACDVGGADEDLRAVPAAHRTDEHAFDSGPLCVRDRFDRGPSCVCGGGWWTAARVLKVLSDCLVAFA